ncbi:MAG: hypothetical protein AAGL49_10665 [Pseudomonadota bacterium]
MKISPISRDFAVLKGKFSAAFQTQYEKVQGLSVEQLRLLCLLNGLSGVNLRWDDPISARKETAYMFAIREFEREIKGLRKEAA